MSIRRSWSARKSASRSDCAAKDHRSFSIPGGTLQKGRGREGVKPKLQREPANPTPSSLLLVEREIRDIIIGCAISNRNPSLQLQRRHALFYLTLFLTDSEWTPSPPQSPLTSPSPSSSIDGALSLFSTSFAEPASDDSRDL